RARRITEDEAALLLVQTPEIGDGGECAKRGRAQTAPVRRSEARHVEARQFHMRNAIGNDAYCHDQLLTILDIVHIWANINRHAAWGSLPCRLILRVRRRHWARACATPLRTRQRPSTGLEDYP